jgi:hypothetical protein
LSSLFSPKVGRKVNAARIGLLVQALLSGEYTQGTGALRRTKWEPTAEGEQGAGTNDCCLGVGCDVYLAATGVGEWRKKDEDGLYEFVALPVPEGFEAPGASADSETFKSGAVMPAVVRDWFGLPDDLHSDMIGWNDDYHHSFATIAADLKSEVAKRA